MISLGREPQAKYLPPLRGSPARFHRRRVCGAGVSPAQFHRCRVCGAGVSPARSHRRQRSAAGTAAPQYRLRFFGDSYRMVFGALTSTSLSLALNEIVVAFCRSPPGNLKRTLYPPSR